MPRPTIRSVRQLVQRGFVPESQLKQLDEVAKRYSVAITPAVAKLIGDGDLNDAISRQFVPSAEELKKSDAESADPIGDDAHSPVKGIVHRYPDRALLKPTHVCSVYCRYCFRRERIGSNGDGAISPAELDDCFNYLRAHKKIWEVIVTGGDPFVLSLRRLREILQKLSQIDHIRVIRIHTRVPTVAPERISADLVGALKSAKRAVYVVIHVNHQDELHSHARAACGRLVDAGIPLLSQTVLLRGVNDDADQLAQLMRTLVENRIKPYYLHHCDLAPGTGHFRTSIAAGQRIVKSLRGNLSGLCQPSYVIDIPGGAGKSPVGPSYVVAHKKGAGDAAKYILEDFEGNLHSYECI